jgi:hypothetical protein
MLSFFELQTKKFLLSEFNKNIIFTAILVGIEKSVGGVLRQAAVSKVGPICVKRSGCDRISVSASLAQICKLQKNKDPRLLATTPK